MKTGPRGKEELKVQKGKERGELDNRVGTRHHKRTYLQPAAAWRLKRLYRSSEQAAITWEHRDHTPSAGVVDTRLGHPGQRLWEAPFVKMDSHPRSHKSLAGPQPALSHLSLPPSQDLVKEPWGQVKQFLTSAIEVSTMCLARSW